VIPRVFHAFWGGPPMPAHLAAYLRRWQELHPYWEFRLWTPDNLPRLRNQDLFDAPEIYSPKSNPWQWRSDLARYELLYDMGGVYIDCDLEPLKPVDPLLAGCTAVIAREDRRMINNAFMGCVPRDPFITDVLERLRPALNAAGPGKRVNQQIGAHYLTRAARRHPHLRILDRRVIYPVHWTDVKYGRAVQVPDGAYTVHRWHNQATLREARQIARHTRRTRPGAVV